jgi:DNA-binding beta-propeller fold protein YncE
MADEVQASGDSRYDPGTGWQVRIRNAPTPDWDAPRAPQPMPAPIPPQGLDAAPDLLPPPPPTSGVAPSLDALVAPPAPPPLVPVALPPTLPPARKPRSALTGILAAVVVVALIAGGGYYLLGRNSPAAVLSTPLPSDVAVIHSGPAQLVLQPLTGGAATRTVKLPGSPDAILATPDRSKAFLLDGAHGDVIPVDLVSGRVSAAIPVGKLPVDEAISADGSTLYVTDNLGGTVIPINTATDRLEPAQPLARGVDFYVPSPTGSGALVGAVTSPGQPGVVYFYNPGTGTGSPVAVGSNPADAAFYSADGATVWVIEAGLNSRPGAVIPINVATRKPGTPVKLGIAPGAYALTPNRARLVIANSGDSTVSIVDLVKRVVVATVPVGATPTSLDIDAAGTTAWVASATKHQLVPVNLLTNLAGSPVTLDNAPGDLALPAAGGVAWVLFPSSNGTVNFLDGTAGPFDRSIHVGNGPDLMIGTGSETSWVANALTNTVQRINAAGHSAGAPISVFQTPSELKLTPDGSALLVLSYGDGVHPGALTSINTTTSKAGTPISVGAGPTNLTISPTGDVVFIADYHANAVVVVDLPNWKVKGVLPLPCGPTDLAVTPDESQLFIACGDSSAILPIKLPDYTFETVLAVPNMRQLLMPVTGTRLLVICANGLVTVDTDTDKVTKSVPETANLISVVETTDGGTILALDNSGAALLVIDPVTLATRKSLSLGTRPDELALSPDNLAAYVLDAGQQKLFVIDVSTWKVTATLGVSPDAVGVVVPDPVVVPPSS